MFTHKPPLKQGVFPDVDLNSSMSKTHMNILYRSDIFVRYKLSMPTVESRVIVHQNQKLTKQARLARVVVHLFDTDCR